jgi:hypothetical protein
MKKRAEIPPLLIDICELYVRISWSSFDTLSREQLRAEPADATRGCVTFSPPHPPTPHPPPHQAVPLPFTCERLLNSPVFLHMSVLGSEQGRCRLPWLPNNASYAEGGGGGGGGCGSQPMSTVPEFVDPDFAKTSPKRLFSMTENERFGLVFAKTGSINSGKAVHMEPK